MPLIAECGGCTDDPANERGGATLSLLENTHGSTGVEAHPKPRRETHAVQVWAAIGALWLVFILYVWGRWVTSPQFRSVDPGPSRQPHWMDVLQLIWQPLFCLVVLGFLWHFLVKPWRRDGQPSTDGLLCVAFALLFFQDPLSSFTGHWFTYNSNLLLAFVGASQVIMMCTYNIPVAVFIASHPAAWPEDHQARSYFTSHICGATTGRLCPQPGMPTTGNDTVQIGPGNQVILPEGSTAPAPYPPLVQTEQETR